MYGAIIGDIVGSVFEFVPTKDKQIYERRMNSIQRAVQRGSLDAELAETMKRLAKDKMYRAISNQAYAKENYAAEMGQEALMIEARQRENGLPRASRSQ